MVIKGVFEVEESVEELPLCYFNKKRIKAQDVANSILMNPLPDFFREREGFCLQDLQYPVFGNVIPNEEVKFQPNSYELFKNLCPEGELFK